MTAGYHIKSCNGNYNNLGVRTTIQELAMHDITQLEKRRTYQG